MLCAMYIGQDRAKQGTAVLRKSNGKKQVLLPSQMTNPRTLTEPLRFSYVERVSYVRMHVLYVCMHMHVGYGPCHADIRFVETP